jgi:REP element-mobilizing transposase RayT
LHGAKQPRFGEVRIRERGRLPHWEKDSGLYFVTFHLADSLPAPVLEKLVERNQVLLNTKRTGANLLPSHKLLVEEYSPKKIEEYFDRGIGACSLRDPRIADLVADAIQFWHGKRYRLLAWCVMPNHVHVIFRLLPGQELADTVGGWKSYTAKRASRILGRTGSFWQREYYDRLIRKEGELDRAVDYVLRNPAKAGLGDWNWVWSAGEDARTTAGEDGGATKAGRGRYRAGEGLDDKGD